MAMKSGSKEFPGFSEIFSVQEPGGSRAFRAEFACSVDDDFAVTRAEIEPGRAQVRWTMGGKSPSDVVCTTSVAPVIVSDRIIDLCKRLEFTGWTTYPVELAGKDGVPIPGYQGVAVSGRCGAIDNERSVMFDKAYPGGVFPCWRGLYFDPATWDGSDVFIPGRKGAAIFVTNRVRRAMIRAKVRNVRFTALDQCERPLLYPMGD